MSDTQQNGPDEKAGTPSFEQISASGVRTSQEANQTIRRLFDVAAPGAVYGDPVTAGEYTVITAGEISVGMGLGFGTGGGGDEKESGGGSGGGGGGASMGRPVAVISVGPNGVHVEPVVDPTKIAIAFFTALGAIFLAGRRMGKMRRELEKAAK